MAMGDRVRDRALYRIAAAAILLAEEDPEPALQTLAPVIEGDAEVSHPLTASIDALLWAAAAHERARRPPRRRGNRWSARSSSPSPRESSLPVRRWRPSGTCSSATRDTAQPRHAAAEILDVLAGSRPRRAGRGAAARGAQRGRAPSRPIPADQPEGARDRRGAVRLAEHGPHPPAPHLRQARRPQPRRGGRPCSRAGPAGPVAPALGSRGSGAAGRGAPRGVQLSSSASAARSGLDLPSRLKTTSSATPTSRPSSSLKVSTRHERVRDVGPIAPQPPWREMLSSSWFVNSLNESPEAGWTEGRSSAAPLDVLAANRGPRTQP